MSPNAQETSAPNKITDGVAYSLARWAIPVSPLIASRAIATNAASPKIKIAGQYGLPAEASHLGHDEAGGTSSRRSGDDDSVSGSSQGLREGTEAADRPTRLTPEGATPSGFQSSPFRRFDRQFLRSNRAEDMAPALEPTPFWQPLS